jgi:hypothetical protein
MERLEAGVCEVLYSLHLYDLEINFVDKIYFIVISNRNHCLNINSRRDGKVYYTEGKLKMNYYICPVRVLKPFVE